jgi:hypothetical protein
MPLHLSLDPAWEPAHWFILDLAILRDHGLPLAGPPARSWSGRSRGHGCWETLRNSLVWHAAHESLTHQTVLNASRAWRYAPAHFGRVKRLHAVAVSDRQGRLHQRRVLGPGDPR